MGNYAKELMIIKKEMQDSEKHYKGHGYVKGRMHEFNIKIDGLHVQELDKRIPNKLYTLIITYPLEKDFRLKIKPRNKEMTLGDIVAVVGRAYRYIYKHPKKFGIWGHGIGDLWLEFLEIKGNKIYVHTGS